MNERAAIEAAMAAANVSQSIESMRDLSGGCIHRVVELSLDDGHRIVAKLNRSDQLPLFQEEARGLRALAATGTVAVPHPLGVAAHGGTAVLLMSAIDSEPGTPRDSWAQLGRDLAALHAAPLSAELANRGYGFDQDNHLGSTLQPNGWRDDWVEFNAVNRLGFQVETASASGLLTANEVRLLTSVIDQLPQFIPHRPPPSLLHGDLWSGNALPTMHNNQPTCAVIDPACYVGDGWADIAMMKLFGGFDRACFTAYESVRAQPDDLDSRLSVYQLYHLLNHVNIFGRGYAGQAMSLARSLLA